MSDKLEQQLQDYSFSRATYYALIERGLSGLDKIAELAEESEHPRAFEVFATFIKTMADTNDKLIDLQMKNAKLEVERLKTEGPKLIEVKDTSNKIVFTGGTVDVLDALESENHV